MSDQKSTPGAGFPPPEKESTPGAFPDLSAHSDSPAWLSEDGNHDAGVWERSFEGAGDGEMAAAEEADGAGSVVNAPATDAGADGDGTAAVELPPEPVVVAPEELKLEEPSLAEPTLSDDAVEAAALDQVASETAAAEATAAEAGRLSGLEPAPAGTEVQVDANTTGADGPGETGEAATLSAPTAEDGEVTASDPDSAAATTAEGSAETDAAADGSGDEDVPDSAEGAVDPTADGAAAVDPTAERAVADESKAGSTQAEAVPDSTTVADESEAGSTEAENASASDTSEPVEEREPAGEAEHEPSQADAEPHPLHGINAAAPMTAAHRTPAPVAVSGEPEPVTAAVPAGDTRRSRRLAESQAAGATAAVKQSGASSGTTDSATGAGTAAGITPAAVKDSGNSKRNTRLLLVLGGIVLAAVAAILLFVFVFNGKEEGVISEDVSPLELADGACLKDWEDVNSSATVVTCETPHNAQLVATDSFTEDAAFPGTGALEERVNEVCDAVDYTDNTSSYPDLKLAKSIPTEQTWASGDRRVDCIVFAPEGQELTESLVQE